MSKRYIKSILAALIAVAPIVYGAENNLPEQSAQVQIADTQVVAQTTSVVDQKTVMVTAPDAQKAPPMLIGFDLNLYKEYCQARYDACDKVYKEKMNVVLYGLVFAGLGILTIKNIGFLNVPSYISTALTTFWKHSLIEKGFDLQRIYQLVQMGLFTVVGFHTATTLGKSSDDCETWEKRAFLPVQEKHALWQQQIYALFGTPEVIGSMPITGKYIIKGYKKYGAGIVIFDPFDQEQVKILLGMGRIREDLRCSKIEIIPV